VGEIGDPLDPLDPLAILLMGNPPYYNVKIIIYLFPTQADQADQEDQEDQEDR